MKNYLVKDVMVPIDEYATVSEEATLFESLLALEKSQERYQQSRYSQRAVLVLDHNKQVVGKLTQMDFLKALEPCDAALEQIKGLHRFGFSRKAIILQQEEYLKHSPQVQELYSRASQLKVIDFMHHPEEGDYVEDTTSLEMALHQLTIGSASSLLVTRSKVIVGILRLADVFAAVFHAIKKRESSASGEDRI